MSWCPPALVVAAWATPTSTPTTAPVVVRVIAGWGAENETCQRPARSFVTRAIPCSPSGRVSRNRTHPTLGTWTSAHLPEARRTLTSRTQNPSLIPLRRQRGRPWVPAHQFRNAWSKSRKACCCTDEEPSPSHDARRASASCRNRSAEPGAGPRPRRQQLACSNARFHTNRASAQCRSQPSACAGPG